MTPYLTPQGRLLLAATGDVALEPALAARLSAAFARSSGHGLLRLGAAELGQPMPPAFGYWREFAGRFVTALCTSPALDEGRPAVAPPPAAELATLAAAAPPMQGAEYLSAEVLGTLWTALGEAFTAELAAAKVPLADFLARLSPEWHRVGRVHFHLAENRPDSLAPFAFLATYTHRLTAQGKAQHLPLGDALREYAGTRNRDKLLSLLLPVQRAAAQCDWLKTMVDSGELYHPLRWSSAEAFRLLTATEMLERAGIIVRMPAGWRAGRPPRPQVTATVGAKAPSLLGADALLDFSMELTLDGRKLSAAEVKAILAGADGLALLRGQWVEIDRERLAAMMDRFQAAARLARAGGLSFAEAMRLLAGTDLGGKAADDDDREWSRVVAGPWLAETLRGLRAPEALAALEPGRELHGTLRPYQSVGLRWLYLLARLRLGACLADDMGLGKTVQVLALLLALRRSESGRKRPNVLVAPASLLANWVSEIERFTPGLKALVAHPSFMPAEELRTLPRRRLAGVDLVITSYGTLLRVPWLTATPWRLAILDEAQAIKNPGAKQTRAVKQLQAQARIALTGTPIENRLGDLWSLFDFINPGLLGSSKEFSVYARRLDERSHNAYGPLRELVRPYILRRLKTDKAIIADLPDKTELKTYCPLSRRQAALYEQAVRELAAKLVSAEAGIERKGLVLASLMRLRQICNHPSQWLGDGTWAEADSGKWSRLRELTEVIAARQEKALVFTQFREVTAPLASFLGDVFGRPGLVLHGETAVAKRRDLVRRFQEDEAVPFFVLSLKAGGLGLNLTAASHVLHFDRRWG
ncbi:DEAD/DEAH box helicase, partial [bacterium]|nr:DEAD/DEAH box helicase [bacterium]